MVEKCLWKHETNKKCVTKKDVDVAVQLAIKSADDNLTKRWLQNPNFKKGVIETGKKEHIYPSTIVDSFIEGSYPEDMRYDLVRWKKRKLK